MTATDHAVELVATAARAASDKLASQIVAFDVSEQLAITDAFLLASATNDRQVKAIVDEVEDKLREIGAKPIRREGERDGRWVLIDYGDDRRARPARGGAAVLRPRAAVARLPGDRAARRRRLRTTQVTAHGSSCSGTARPRGTSIGRAQGHADVSLDDTGHAQAAAAAPYLAAMRPGPAVVQRPGPRPGDRGVRRRGHRACEVELDPRLREYDVGERSGLTTAEFAERHPERVRRAGRPTTSRCRSRARSRPRSCASACCRR